MAPQRRVARRGVALRAACACSTVQQTANKVRRNTANKAPDLPNSPPFPSACTTPPHTACTGVGGPRAAPSAASPVHLFVVGGPPEAAAAGARVQQRAGVRRWSAPDVPVAVYYPSGQRGPDWADCGCPDVRPFRFDDVALIVGRRVIAARPRELYADALAYGHMCAHTRNTRAPHARKSEPEQGTVAKVGAALVDAFKRKTGQTKGDKED
eukprot:gene26741-18478_t